MESNNWFESLSLRLSELPGSGFDLWVAVGLWATAALVALAYRFRVFLRGRAQFDRVSRQGGSSLLGEGVMQGGYWFFQPMGKLLLFLHVTPNQISWASLVSGIAAGVCFSVGHFGSGALFGTISVVLDALDGMVARAMGISSEAGEVLDATIDRYVEFIMLFGLVYYYRPIPVLMLLAAAALIGSFMVSYSSAKAEAMHVDPPKGSMRRPERAVYLLVAAGLTPVTIPWLERIREYPIAIGHPMVISLGIMAVMANASAIERLMAVARAVKVRETAQRHGVAASAVLPQSGSSSDEIEAPTLPGAPELQTKDLH